jgi:hypothetical protein
VIAISPLAHNWAVRFLSHAIYRDEQEFEAALRQGEVARCIEDVRRGRRSGTNET